MSKLILLLDGKETPFYSASITYSMDQLAHTFDASIEPQMIAAPLPVQFTLDGKSIFTGQIDRVSRATNSSSMSISINGRSKSANLIDSTITMDAEYGQDLSKLLTAVVSKFGMSVDCQVKTDTVDEFQINAESPINSLAQLVKEQGFILIERQGQLVIEKPAEKQADLALQVGKNLSSISIEQNFATRFNKIEVEGAWGEKEKGTAIDSAINKQRVKVIVADQLQGQKNCQSRADYEKGFAIANSLTVSTSLPFITQELGLNELNRVIRVVDESQQFNQQMLIKSITLSVSDSEQTTALSLCVPFAEVRVADDASE